MKNSIFFSIALMMAAPCFAQPDGVMVVAGGGEEGNPGDKNAWNYDLYGRLVKNGDTNGDKKIKVVVLSYYEQDDHYKDTFKSLGADEVEKLPILKRGQSSDPRILKKIKDADVVFFRGGDQAEYYKNIRGTPLKKELDKLRDRGGAFGGTSAGAMSLAEFALAGGQELGSDDTLSDGHSPLLQDAYNKKKSSIKNDFLGMVKNVTIDTHCGERARLGRIMGVHAKATEDFNKKDMLGLCVSEQTGIAISKGKAQVYGNGVVEIIKQTPDTKVIRTPGEPLTYTDLKLHALTEGWQFDIANGEPDTTHLPKGANAITQKRPCSGVQSEVRVNGSEENGASQFQYSTKLDNKGFATVVQDKAPIKGIIGVTKAQSYDKDPKGNTLKAVKLASVYRALYDQPRATAFLVSDTSQVLAKETNQVQLQANSKEQEQASIIIDCSECTYSGLSPRLTELDNGSQTLRLATVINAKVHAIGNSAKSGATYDLASHKVMLTTRGTEAEYCVQCETAQRNNPSLQLQTTKEAISAIDDCRK